MTLGGWGVAIALGRARMNPDSPKLAGNPKERSRVKIRERSDIRLNRQEWKQSVLQDYPIKKMFGGESDPFPSVAADIK